MLPLSTGLAGLAKRGKGVSAVAWVNILLVSHVAAMHLLPANLHATCLQCVRTPTLREHFFLTSCY
jgi:hypothetical protein